MMVVATAFIITPDLLLALDIETLLMPGRVVEGHAEIEEECSKCHTRFSKSTQTQLCLDCHEDVDDDVKNKAGYHGRIENVATTECKSCHAEHLGRDADIVRLDPLVFDHAQTDFALEDSHTTVACSACHEADKRHAEAPSDCYSCHDDDEPHQGNLGEDCHDCHTVKSWKKFKFDHDDTDFPLRGVHKDTACNTCHINEKYEDMNKDCHGCHAVDDVHNGVNGNKCADCHNERKWTESDFDHDKDTDFRLKGSHADVSCTACHKDPVKDKKPDTECVSCHKNDDAHHGRFGKKCQTCHSEQQWSKVGFDHGRDTDFTLRGKHKKLLCNACHRGDLYDEELSVNCFSCHEPDDVHAGQQGEQCQRCHQDTGWGDQVVFDHDLTRFPLLGLHATVPCEECHLSSAFQDTKMECISCHQDDDSHKKVLGPDCRTCHNPNSWSMWIFDHGKQTDFELLGAHEDLYCGDCHKRPVDDAVSKSQQCRTCHKQDDIHHGRFGSDCARCHTTKDFRDVQFTR